MNAPKLKAYFCTRREHEMSPGGIARTRRSFFLAALPYLVLLAATASAEPPSLYQRINGAVWIVRRLEPTIAAWRAVGVNVTAEPRPINGVAARFASGQIGDFRIDLIEPDASNAPFYDFLRRHGDGVLAIVHPADREAVQRETERLKRLGVGVLCNFELDAGQYTLFDTEVRGKYALGLVTRSVPAPDRGDQRITHLGLVIRDPRAVSAFWESLSFPAMTVVDAAPREDGRYREQPLLLPFRVGWHKYSHPTLEWIIPPQSPANCYADFLARHGEGVQHLGLPVDDLGKEVARYRNLGYAVWQRGAWGQVGKPDSGQYAYMETEVLGGVSVELIHAYH